jgi:hypothetical protein
VLMLLWEIMMISDNIITGLMIFDCRFAEAEAVFC